MDLVQIIGISQRGNYTPNSQAQNFKEQLRWPSGYDVWLEIQWDLSAQVQTLLAATALKTESLTS